MAIKTSFFNGPAYNADTVNERFSYMFTNGIITETIGVGTDLQVAKQTGLSLTVGLGRYHLQGAVFEIYDILCKPFEYGADIIVHSTSKYMDGHALQVGGVIIDSGKFDWKSGNFPGLTKPDKSYHGIPIRTLMMIAHTLSKRVCS